MTAITPFVFQDHLVRSISCDGDPWFVLADICGALELTNPRKVAATLEPDEVSTVTISDGQGGPERNIVSLPGTWRIIGRSRAPKAKPFQRWLYHDVIPALFKTGTYTMPGSSNEPYTQAGDPFSITSESVSVVKVRIDMVAECRRLHGHERARALWQSLGLPLGPIHVKGPQHDARACFLHLLLARLPNGQTFAEAIDQAMDEQEEPRIVLKLHGVVVEPGVDGVIVANRGQFLEKIYEGTDWAYCRWRHALRRLAGASGEDTRRRYGDRQHRGTFVPATYLDFATLPDV